MDKLHGKIVAWLQYLQMHLCWNGPDGLVVPKIAAAFSLQSLRCIGVTIGQGDVQAVGMCCFFFFYQGSNE